MQQNKFANKSMKNKEQSKWETENDQGERESNNERLIGARKTNTKQNADKEKEMQRVREWKEYKVPSWA